MGLSCRCHVQQRIDFSLRKNTIAHIVTGRIKAIKHAKSVTTCRLSGNERGQRLFNGGISFALPASAGRARRHLAGKQQQQTAAYLPADNSFNRARVASSFRRRVTLSIYNTRSHRAVDSKRIQRKKYRRGRRNSVPAFVVGCCCIRQ